MGIFNKNEKVQITLSREEMDLILHGVVKISEELIEPFVSGESASEVDMIMYPLKHLEQLVGIIAKEANSTTYTQHQDRLDKLSHKLDNILSKNF